MGEAIDIAKIEKNMYVIASCPIHSTIQQLIHVLESRQNMAKRYMEASSKIKKETCLEFIKAHEKGIISILQMQNHE